MGNIISHNTQIPSLPVQGDGSIQVWFATRELLFTTQAPKGYYVVEATQAEHVSLAKIVTFLENYNSVVVLSSQPLESFGEFAAQMKWVEAAGGVVENEYGEIAMIRRNERWDLPKGHREQGESYAECAAREAEEETGVKVNDVGELLATTLHAYNIYGSWELKFTAWYAMRASKTPLRPQREEGIVCAEWIASSEVRERIKRSFPTIKTVFSAFFK